METATDSRGKRPGFHYEGCGCGERLYEGDEVDWIWACPGLGLRFPDTKPLRISYLVPHWNVTGGNKMLMFHLMRLKQRGHWVQAVFRAPPPEAGLPPPTSALPPWARGFVKIDSEVLLGPQQSLLDCLQNSDVVMVGYFTQLVEFLEDHQRQQRQMKQLHAGGDPAVQAAEQKRFGRKLGSVVYWDQGHEHVFGDPTASKAWDRVFHLAMHLPVPLVSVSNVVRDILAVHFARVAPVVPNAIDCRRFLPTPRERRFPGARYPGQAKRVLLVGNPALKLKNFDTALKALELVHSRMMMPPGRGAAAVHPAGIHVTWICQVQPQLQGVTFPVQFEVNPSQEVLPEIYRRGYDAFLFTSVYEAWGMPVLEAMASHIPVVTSRCHGVNMFCQHEKNCLMADPFDHEALARCVQALVTDPSKADQLARRGRRVAARLTWDSAMTALESALYQVQHYLGDKSKPSKLSSSLDREPPEHLLPATTVQGIKEAASRALRRDAAGSIDQAEGVDASGSTETAEVPAWAPGSLVVDDDGDEDEDENQAGSSLHSAHTSPSSGPLTRSSSGRTGRRNRSGWDQPAPAAQSSSGRASSSSASSVIPAASLSLQQALPRVAASTAANAISAAMAAGGLTGPIIVAGGSWDERRGQGAHENGSGAEAMHDEEDSNGDNASGPGHYGAPHHRLEMPAGSRALASAKYAGDSPLARDAGMPAGRFVQSGKQAAAAVRPGLSSGGQSSPRQHATSAQSSLSPSSASSSSQHGDSRRDAPARPSAASSDMLLGKRSAEESVDKADLSASQQPGRSASATSPQRGSRNGRAGIHADDLRELKRFAAGHTRDAASAAAVAAAGVLSGGMHQPVITVPCLTNVPTGTLTAGGARPGETDFGLKADGHQAPRHLGMRARLAGMPGTAGGAIPMGGRSVRAASGAESQALLPGVSTGHGLGSFPAEALPGSAAYSSAETLAAAVSAVAPAVAKVMARAATHVLKRTSSAPADAGLSDTPSRSRPGAGPPRQRSSGSGHSSSDMLDATVSTDTESAAGASGAGDDPWAAQEPSRVIDGVAQTPESGRARQVTAPSLSGDSPVLQANADGAEAGIPPLDLKSAMNGAGPEQLGAVAPATADGASWAHSAEIGAAEHSRQSSSISAGSISGRTAGGTAMHQHAMSGGGLQPLGRASVAMPPPAVPQSGQAHYVQQQQQQQAAYQQQLQLQQQQQLQQFQQQQRRQAYDSHWPSNVRMAHPQGHILRQLVTTRAVQETHEAFRHIRSAAQVQPLPTHMTGAAAPSTVLAGHQAVQLGHMQVARYVGAAGAAEAAAAAGYVVPQVGQQQLVHSVGAGGLVLQPQYGFVQHQHSGASLSFVGPQVPGTAWMLHSVSGAAMGGASRAGIQSLSMAPVGIPPTAHSATVSNHHGSAPYGAKQHQQHQQSYVFHAVPQQPAMSSSSSSGGFGIKVGPEGIASRAAGKDGMDPSLRGILEQAKARLRQQQGNTASSSVGPAGAGTNAGHKMSDGDDCQSGSDDDDEDDSEGEGEGEGEGESREPSTQSVSQQLGGGGTSSVGDSRSQDHPPMPAALMGPSLPTELFESPADTEEGASRAALRGTVASGDRSAGLVLPAGTAAALGMLPGAGAPKHSQHALSPPNPGTASHVPGLVMGAVHAASVPLVGTVHAVGAGGGMPPPAMRMPAMQVVPTLVTSGHTQQQQQQTGLVQQAQALAQAQQFGAVRQVGPPVVPAPGGGGVSSTWGYAASGVAPHQGALHSGALSVGAQALQEASCLVAGTPAPPTAMPAPYGGASMGAAQSQGAMGSPPYGQGQAQGQVQAYGQVHGHGQVPMMSSPLPQGRADVQADGSYASPDPWGGAASSGGYGMAGTGGMPPGGAGGQESLRGGSGGYSTHSLQPPPRPGY